MEHSRLALGRVIRELREAQTPRLSQEELGRRAGYRTGAGVSMSRIENGVTRPTARRLEGIASALGVSVTELQTRGGQAPAAAGPAGSAGPATGRRPGAALDGESTTERMRRIQGEFERRNLQAVAAASAFNDSHDRARDDFFLAVVSTARSIQGLPAVDLVAASPPTPTTADPTPRPTGPSGGAGCDQALLRRELAARGIAAVLEARTGSAPDDGPRAPTGQPTPTDEAEREAAYESVVAAAVLSSARAHPDTPATDTARATRALLGGARAVGGSRLAAGALLTGLVATAASPLFAATTLFWLARRSRKQNDQLARELDQAEATLTSSQRGFDTVMSLLGRATACLDYIALHGGHAQRRWQSQLPPAPRSWGDLGPDQQRQLAAFVELAACQVCVDTIDMTELLAASGPHQDGLLRVADAVLTLARQDAERLV